MPWITDSRQRQLFGDSGLYLVQNGLLLDVEVYAMFDLVQIAAINPDVRSRFTLFFLLSPLI